MKRSLETMTDEEFQASLLFHPGRAYRSRSLLPRRTTRSLTDRWILRTGESR